MSEWTIAGRLVTGLGQGAGFTSLDWAREQFIALFGIDPHPGTFNIEIQDGPDQLTWDAVRSRPGNPIIAGEPGACDARGYPIRIADTVFGAIVLPEVSGYPERQIEIIAAVPIRDHLSVTDGAMISIEGQAPQRFSAAIFDVDGTLMNSLDGYRIAAHRAAEKHGYSVTLEHVRQALNFSQPFWDLVLPKEVAADEDFVAQLRTETMRHWPDALVESVSVLPGLKETLEQLIAGGVRLAVYTGSEGESFAPLQQAGIMDLFEVVITASDVEQRKPSPDGIRQCLDIMDLPCDDAVYVGDSIVDVKAGLAAGVMSVGVLTGAGDSASLYRAGAHRVLADVSRIVDLLDLD